MNKWFSEDMSMNEARHKFFSILDGKSEEEKVAIKKEYYEVCKIIIKRDLELVKQGCLF